jgi:hypothetical protein
MRFILYYYITTCLSSLNSIDVGDKHTQRLLKEKQNHTQRLLKEKQNHTQRLLKEKQNHTQRLLNF